MKKKVKLKDSVKMYAIIFISIFATTTLFYVSTYSNVDELNECLQDYDLDYCNKVVR